jgi:hypothetical protein
MVKTYPATMRTGVIRLKPRNARWADTAPPSPGHESRTMAQVCLGVLNPVDFVCNESN